MKQHRKPMWTAESQAAAQATHQARRDACPAAPADDARPALVLFIGPERGDPLVHWRLLPYGRNVRQYRAIDAPSGEPVRSDDGLPLIGGNDALMREATRRLPQYRVPDSLRWFSATDEEAARVAHES